MSRYSTLDPIAALGTPWGESAVAVIRTSGKKCLQMLEGLFTGRAPLSTAKGNTIRHGFIIDPATGERIDEVLVSVYRCPRSYTGEDVAEIVCHGSFAIIKAILALLFRHGFRQAGPGEFTMRAFLNKKMDLTRAEAVNDVVRARTDRSRACALARLSGGVESRIGGLKQRLLTLLAGVEAALDYPDDELDGNPDYDSSASEVEREASSLLATYASGKIIQEGITVVIAGGTNAGKSTLFNLLLREDRSIVSDAHGTTRDYVEGHVSLEGIPMRLFDTAGIRESSNPVEIEGMKRTDRIVKNANLVLYIVDAKTGLTEADKHFLESQPKKARIICIWNKIDACKASPPPGFVAISARLGKGIDLLFVEISKAVLCNLGSETQEVVIDSVRQKELLERTLRAVRDFRSGLKQEMPLDVVAICLSDGLNALGEITGEVTSQEVLESIFSQFCVGK